MKTLKQIREASGGKEAYQKFFNSILKKFGVSSPSELEGKKKKDFFDAIDKGWESDDPNDKNETYTDPDNLDPDTTLNPDEDDEDDLDEVHNGNADDESPKKKVDDNEGNYSGVDEKAPPGMEDVVKKLKQDHSDEEAFAIAWSIYNKKETEAELISEIFSRAQMKKAIGIARKSKGQYTKAYNEIEKIKKGLADEHIIAAALKRANESTDDVVAEGKHLGNISQALLNLSKKPEFKKISKQLSSLSKRAAEGDKKAATQLYTQLTALAKKADKKQGAQLAKIGKLAKTYEDVSKFLNFVSEGVDVDRRTLGFKAAMIRNEKAKKVREKSKLKKEKKKEQEVLDARYDYDGEVDAVLAAANKKIFGETAANSAASGNVDMAPNSRGKKKKKDLKVIRRATY